MSSDFRDLLFELNESEVRYLVVGGYAFFFHATPLAEVTAVSFAEAWNRRHEAKYSDQRMWVLSKADLIANKRSVGRPRDLEDVAELERDVSSR